MPTPQPTPAPPQPTPTPPVSITTSILDYDKLAEAILAKIDLATLRGAKGDKGDTGDAATAPAIDYDVLAQAVIARLPPQRVEWERLDGTVLKQAKPLGEPLKFKSVEIDQRK